ncbi:hypothetical protein GGI15_000078 [Coemansia interrupta]|uniref:Uncharacterized protein n=1 Tax=Coemansia interrupta TaxID=1126814 RepID=A0A9W8LPX2_9FUNG|nr:hypothetical protein GGI15_000078 [Coemansia interrupta]
MSHRRNSRASTRRRYRPQSDEQESQIDQRDRQLHAEFFRNIVHTTPGSSEQRITQSIPILGSAASDEDFALANGALDRLWDHILRSSRLPSDAATVASETQTDDQSRQSTRLVRQRAGVHYDVDAGRISDLEDGGTQADGWTLVNIRPRDESTSPPRMRRRRMSGGFARLVAISNNIPEPETQDSAASEDDSDSDGSSDDSSDGETDSDGYSDSIADSLDLYNNVLDPNGEGYHPHSLFELPEWPRGRQARSAATNGDDVDDSISHHSDNDLANTIDEMFGPFPDVEASGNNSELDFSSVRINRLIDGQLWQPFGTIPGSGLDEHDFITRTPPQDDTASPEPLPSSSRKKYSNQVSVTVRQSWNKERLWKPYIYQEPAPNARVSMRSLARNADSHTMRGMDNERAQLYSVHSEIHPIRIECTNADDMGRGTLNNMFSPGNMLFVTSRQNNVNIELAFDRDHKLAKHRVVERILIQSSRSSCMPCTELMVFASSRRLNFSELRKYDNFTFARYEKLSEQIGKDAAKGIHAIDPRPIAYFWMEYEEGYKQLQILPQGVTCKYLYIKMIRGRGDSKAMSLKYIRVYGWDGPRAFSESALC